jgi:hypothetical protein
VEKKLPDTLAPIRQKFAQGAPIRLMFQDEARFTATATLPQVLHLYRWLPFCVPFRMTPAEPHSTQAVFSNLPFESRISLRRYSAASSCRNSGTCRASFFSGFAVAPGAILL